MLDPFKALLAENHLVSANKLAPYIPAELRVAVALDGAILGELPGAPRLYILAREISGEFRTEEIVDLAALGLCQAGSQADVGEFTRGIGLLLAKLKGVGFMAAKKFSGILPGRLIASDIPYLMEGDFGLDSLAAAINEALDPAKTLQPKKVEPRPIRAGHYYLDLKKALLEDPDLSSKKILNPFFKEVKFQKLILKCDHQPRWLPEAAKQLGYAYEYAQEPDGLIVTLTRQGEFN
ncbi:MAG: hypothetical protein LBT38_09795 [Deltaproteobacteria bacterium]|jgi:hypothetical protein|nr:hypothetical protein [Deltaproteobacteria bacterium]